MDKSIVGAEVVEINGDVVLFKKLSPSVSSCLVYDYIVVNFQTRRTCSAFTLKEELIPKMITKLYQCLDDDTTSYEMQKACVSR